MKKALQFLKQHYLFSLRGGEGSAYSFRTRFDVGNILNFRPAVSVFNVKKAHAALVYLIDVRARFSGPQSYVRNDVIAPTMAAAFLPFYNGQYLNTCFLLKDLPNAKDQVRKQKLTDWCEEKNRGAFSKIDVATTVENRRTPLSFLLLNGNTHAFSFFDAFTNCLSLQ